MGTVVMKPICCNCGKVIDLFFPENELHEGVNKPKYNSRYILPRFCPNCNDSLETFVAPITCETADDYMKYLDFVREQYGNVQVL